MKFTVVVTSRIVPCPPEYRRRQRFAIDLLAKYLMEVEHDAAPGGPNVQLGDGNRESLDPVDVAVS
jgi:hypothetical protein